MNNTLMYMMYYYIDESGDLGKSSKYFIVGGIATNNPKNLNNIINKAHRRFKKKYKPLTEIKGYKTPDIIIKYILNYINNPDYTTFALVFNKENLYRIQYNNKNHLYNILGSYLASNISVGEKSEIHIDKSKTKEKDMEEFNTMFKTSLINPYNYPITIEHSSSINYKPLQVADLIVWSYFQHYENKNPIYKNLFDKTRNYTKIID